MCPEGAFKPNAAVPKQYPGGVVKSMAASDPEKLAGGFASYLALGAIGAILRRAAIKLFYLPRF